jgi:uncharacterized protein
MAEPNGTSRRDFLRVLAGTGVGLGLTAGAPGCSNAQEPAAGGPEAAPAAEPLAAVPRRTLGSSGQSVPILLVGGTQPFDPRYDKLLHRAFKEGADYLDTALSYAGGRSHKTIAPFLKQVGRKNVWVTSKGSSSRATPAKFQASLETCLEQLETDYLDLYFMHAVNDLRLLDKEFLDMGEAMRKSGKTRFFGFSCHGGRVAELLEKAAETGGIDAIMFRYSFASYGDLKLNRAMDRCVKAGIGLIAMKTMESVPAENEEVVRFQSRRFTLAQAKLKAVWADERIAAAVSLMDNTKKLAENLAAARSPLELSMSEMQELQRIARAGAPYACKGCSHICEPLLDAPVKVADPLRYLMYHECYGQTDLARAGYERLRGEERALEGVDFARASAACPQGIDIAARLGRARDELGGLA